MEILVDNLIKFGSKLISYEVIKECKCSTSILLKNCLHSVLHGKNSEYKTQLSRIEVASDLLYDSLHTGEWHAVDLNKRELFTLCCYLKVLLILLSSDNPEDSVKFKDCMYITDLGILLGAKITIGKDDLLTETASILTKYLNETESESSPCKKFKIETRNLKQQCDIPILDKPTIEYFSTYHYISQKPVILRNTIEHWPAFAKWHDPNYLIKLAGNRIVPIEIGGQYTHDNWSQGLIKFKEFVQDHLENGTAYLAQHDLFDQIPELKKDIQIPDYIGQTDLNPRIKAWLGPKSTISPFHTDPTHNLLCQVFGSKEIILASPEDNENMYPHDHFVLNNTSQLDAKNLDFEKFPLAKNIKFYHLILQRGDVLYIPPKWWHYVESLSPSFSVSFWFD